MADPTDNATNTNQDLNAADTGTDLADVDQSILDVQLGRMHVALRAFRDAQSASETASGTEGNWDYQPSRQEYLDNAADQLTQIGLQVNGDTQGHHTQQDIEAALTAFGVTADARNPNYNTSTALTEYRGGNGDGYMDSSESNEYLKYLFTRPQNGGNGGPGR